mgnify:CR=1 FL=1
MGKQQDDLDIFDYDSEGEYYEEEYYDDEEYERSFLGITLDGFLGSFVSIFRIIYSIAMALGIFALIMIIIYAGKGTFNKVIGFINHSYYVVYIIPLIFLYLTMNFKSKHNDSASEGAALLFLISLIAIILVEISGYGFINDKNKIKDIEPVVSSVINIIYPK